MIKKQILFSVLAFFVLGGFVCPPINAESAITLDNGVKLIIREDHRNPIVVFSVFIDSGSASEGEYSGSGISHLVEHMLFKGTKKYPPGSIEDILNKYGGNIEGYTSYDYTGYSITILKDHFKIAMDILKEMLTEPLLDSAELKKEKAVIEREMDLGKDDPSRRISRITFETAFMKHPYRLSPIGYEENFQKLSRADLVKFFKSEYVSEKITIAVVGDINSQEIIDKIGLAFGSIPRGNNVKDVRPKEPPQVIERYFEEQSDIEGAYMNISFHSTDLFDKDLYAMDILSFMLGQGESSLLNENLRINSQLALSVSAYNYTPKDPGLFIISSVLKEENVNAALEAILKQIDSVKQNGFSEDELVKAKNNFIAGYIYQKETIENQANDMAESQILTGSPDFFKKYIDNMRSVTMDDVKRTASKYLDKSNMTVTVLSKSGNALKKETGQGLDKEARSAKKILLSNNAPIILSENHSLPVIAISIVFKGGTRVENQDNNGVSKLTSRMLLDGTGSMSRQDMAKFYESRAIALSSYSGNNSIGINLTCLKEHLEDALMLASSICSSPVFPEEEFKREKNEMLEAIDMQDNDIVNHGHRLLKEMLFKTHPYRFQAIGSRDSVEKMTREQIEDFYKNTACARNMAIGISGDFKSAEIAPIVEKYFSSMTKGDDLKPMPSPAKENPFEKIREETLDTDKDQSLILIGFPGVDIYDKDRYAIETFANMLSSPSGVLFKNIREDNGLTYAVGAFNISGIDPGYLAVYALTSGENIPKVKKIIFSELDRLVNSGIKKEDMEKSKNYLKAMRRIGMQTNFDFIFNITMDELYGLGYNDYNNFDNNIDKTGLEDINKAAKRVLKLDRCAVLILKGK